MPNNDYTSKLLEMEDIIIKDVETVNCNIKCHQSDGGKFSESAAS